MQKRWDIFCKIVDNFGDIGVCWRLARQLAHEHGLPVRLFVDDVVTAQGIIPALNPTLTAQTVEDVDIYVWRNDATNLQPAPVVIEAFGCGLPSVYEALMTEHTVWVNLEYLSAEDWVTDFHGKHSGFGMGKPKRHFFYPGFTEKTGGLLRENHLATHDDLVRKEGSAGLEVSLFCYPNAPIGDLFTVLQASKHEVTLYAPVTSILPKIAQFFGQASTEIGEILTCGNLTVKILPFLSQVEYDQLLRRCDLNIVRGEDSWIRAIWAAKPFIWQPYVQNEGAHLLKLEAFLQRFYGDYAQHTMLSKVHEYWSTGLGDASLWHALLAHLPDLQAYCQQQSTKLAAQTDLASNLVIFIGNLRETHV